MLPFFFQLSAGVGSTKHRGPRPQILKKSCLVGPWTWCGQTNSSVPTPSSTTDATWLDTAPERYLLFKSEFGAIWRCSTLTLNHIDTLDPPDSFQLERYLLRPQQSPSEPHYNTKIWAFPLKKINIYTYMYIVFMLKELVRSFKFSWRG